MHIGKQIYEHRIAKKLSQEALAELLDVSRQSVSKWETDSAVPDLDKLIKLCDIFDITLDELTGRAASKPQTTPVSQTPSITQKTIGYILFALSVLCGFILLFFGTNPGDFLILIPTAMSLLICGLLCLFAGKTAFYWCVWAAFAPLSVLTPCLTSLPLRSLLTVFWLFIVIIMLFVAKKVFSDVVILREKKKNVLLVCGWLLTGLIYVLNLVLPFWVLRGSGMVAYSEITSTCINFICYVLWALLETYTVCYLRKTK